MVGVLTSLSAMTQGVQGCEGLSSEVWRQYASRAWRNEGPPGHEDLYVPAHVGVELSVSFNVTRAFIATLT
eukprot:3918181-Amphidinium_carterae.1